MKALIVGGLGYLGSIVADRLHIKGIDVDILDCALFDNGDVIQEINCNNFFSNSTYQAYQNIKPSDYSHIVWTCDIDTYEYYNHDLPEDKFFNECLISDAKFIYIGHFVNKIKECNDISFTQHLKKMENAIFLNDGIFLNCGILHGASPRMRWDTIINQMIYLAVTGQSIVLETDWLGKYPICHVLDAADEIINTIIKNEGKNLISTHMSLVEIAHIVVSYFEDISVQTIRLDEMGNNCIIDNIIDNGKEKDISHSVNFIIKSLESGHLPDFEKDKYNNAVIINSMITGYRTWGKLRG